MSVDFGVVASQSTPAAYIARTSFLNPRHAGEETRFPILLTARLRILRVLRVDPKCLRASVGRAEETGELGEIGE